MIRKFAILVSLILISNFKLFCQLSNNDNIIRESNNIKFYGLYGLSDFVKPDKNLPFDIENLIVKFDTTNTFSAYAGNSFRGEYVISDSNKIKFKNYIGTLAGLQIITKSGYAFKPDLFIDTLFKCNSFSIFGKEIRFFNNSGFKLAIKPYYDLLPFPFRKNVRDNFTNEVKVDTVYKISTFVIINSVNQMEKLGINLRDINFNKKSLVVVENISIQNNKNKEVKRLAKNYKDRESRPFYPVSYAKSYRDSVTDILYLDIVNTYTRAVRTDRERRGRYSGFIIDRVDIDKLKLGITYTK